MGWSDIQRRRLGMEKNILEQYFSGNVTWIDPTGRTKVEVRMTTNNDKRYTLRVYIPEDCLNSCPVMVVSSPSSPLRKKNGEQLVHTSGDYHCWGAHDGLTKICHFGNNTWSNSNTLYQVFMKGRIWLEAYEAHLRTGKPLSVYLAEMKGKAFTMGWSDIQRRRLGMEKNILEQYFSGNVTWIDPTGRTKVEVRMTTNNDKRYTLRVYIPEDCLNSCPVMVVSSPSSPLRMKNGDLLPASSSSYHCWGTHDGFTQICHYRSSTWSNSNTLYQVFMKGRIWLEAYEAHLRTGKPLSAYLAEM